MGAELRGVVLLEVLLALVILGIVGIGAVSIVTDASQAVARASRMEREAIDRDRILTALSLMTARELGDRIGLTTLGSHQIRIARIAPALYAISVGHDRLAMATVVYRAEAR